MMWVGLSLGEKLMALPGCIFISQQGHVMDQIAESTLAFLGKYGGLLIKTVGVIGGIALAKWLATDDDSLKRKDSRMLVLSRKPGEKIRIGDDITITIVRIGPATVRLGIDAPRELNIVRDELVAAIRNQGVDVEVTTTGEPKDELPVVKKGMNSNG